MSETNGIGQSVSIGGKAFVLPLLTLGGLKKVAAQLTTVKQLRKGEIPSADQIDAMIVIVHASAAVTEPELSLDAFRAHVEALPWDTGVEDLSHAFAAVAVRSGLAKQEATEGEAASP